MKHLDLSKLCSIYNVQESFVNMIELELDKQNWSDESKIQFLAQVAHESCGFKVKSENLNYSERGLLTVFPKYFNKESAKKYARKPEQIANIVYANRLGNSDINSGDGWKYRGRGLIQITGKYNYSQFGHENDPEYLATPLGSIESAIWFWNKNKLYNVTDFKLLTKKINGGYNGLNDRLNHYKKIKSIF